MWNDYRAGVTTDNDVYGQMVSIAGSLEGGNFIVTNEAGGQIKARVGAGNGQYLAVWQREEGEGVQTDIFGQRLGETTPANSASLTGPTTGIVAATYAFTATVSPLTTTLPITYDWRASGLPVVRNTGGISDTATFAWLALGSQTVTVTASNAAGSGQRQPIHPIREVSEPNDACAGRRDC